MDDCLLFSRGELLVIRAHIRLKWDSFGAFREGMVLNVKGSSSGLMALELARIIGVKGKLKFPFVLL